MAAASGVTPFALPQGGAERWDGGRHAGGTTAQRLLVAGLPTDERPRATKIPGWRPRAWGKHSRIAAAPQRHSPMSHATERRGIPSNRVATAPTGSGARQRWR